MQEIFERTPEEESKRRDEWNRVLERNHQAYVSWNECLARWEAQRPWWEKLWTIIRGN